MAIGSDLASSITGNIEPACLVVKDYRKIGSVGGMDAVTGLTKRLLNGTATPEDITAADTEKEFQVQFNPSELEIYAYNFSRDMTSAQKDPNGHQTSISTSVLKPTVELNTRLYFDKVNIYDSFMLDKITGGASATTLTNIGSMIASATGKTWTVQPEVEGLVAALRNPYTRNVVFRWSKFSFEGQLHNLGVQYTMFSTSGRPVRAVVNLRLHQEMDDSKLQDWYDDMQDAFGSKGNLGRAEQAVGNWTALGL